LNKRSWKAAGNPFFVEEIVRELIDRGDLVKAGERYICKHPSISVRSRTPSRGCWLLGWTA
jgi:predicted ATPase